MQLELMQNMHQLCPDYFAVKDLLNTAMDIEKFLKDNPDQTGEDQTALDLFSDFLNGAEPQRRLAEAASDDEPPLPM